MVEARKAQEVVEYKNARDSLTDAIDCEIKPMVEAALETFELSLKREEWNEADAPLIKRAQLLLHNLAIKESMAFLSIIFTCFPYPEI